MELLNEKSQTLPEDEPRDRMTVLAMLRAVRAYLNFKHAKEAFFSRDIVKHGAIVENYPVTTPIYMAVQHALIALIRKER